MNQNQKPAQGIGIGLMDIYYVLFRHKWKIIVCTLIGVIAAAVILVTKVPMYRTNATLLIRYVTEKRAVNVLQTEEQKIRSPDERGAGIINSELLILTSRDLVYQVVDQIGASNILRKAGEGDDAGKAARLISSAFSATIVPKSSVISVSCAHPDPEMATRILTQLISAYIKKHGEVHHTVEAHEFAVTQTAQMRDKLRETEARLKQLRNQLGIVDTENAKRIYNEELASARGKLNETEASLAEAIALLKEKETYISIPTNSVVTNLVADRAISDEARLLIEQIAAMRKERIELLSKYTEETMFVQQLDKRLGVAEAERQRLMGTNSALPSSASAAGASSSSPALVQSLMDARARVRSLEEKKAVYLEQMKRTLQDVAALEAVENEIEELERNREMQSTTLLYYTKSVQQAQIDFAVGANDASNISIVQSPSKPNIDPTPIYKRAGAAAGAGFIAGLAWAFLVGLVLDGSVKQPSELEGKLGVAPFFTLPRYARKGRRKAGLPGGNGKALLSANGTEEPGLAVAKSADNAVAEVAPWDGQHQLHDYFQGLRDRLVTYFETRNMTHKPKLVAVTSCSKGAGVTSIAAGLAASLSETGDGNVLLVDMNMGQGAVHPFRRGQPCGLPEALQTEKRDAAYVQDNLYVVRADDLADKFNRILPKRFMHLVPKLKASDYDYIIFDMPAVSQTSIVPRLAGMMDMVFLVVEAEKTNRDLVKRAAGLLAQSKATVGMVLNKYQKRIPDALRPEL